MRNLFSEYHPRNNFWDTFESFKDVDPFAKLHIKDKSPGKRISSMKMWALVLCYDPESDYYNLPDKKNKIKTAMERNHRLKLDWDELDVLENDFYSMFLEQVDQSMLAWEKRMKERDEFLEGIKWTLDSYNDEGKPVKGTADQLDRMHAQTAKHFKEYQIIAKELQELKIKNDNKKKNNVQELDV